jgi:hypothetical protein
MAQLSAITLPNGQVYDLKGSTLTVVGTQNAATNAWTGELTSVTNLYDGLTIAYFLPYTSTNDVTLNLTLKNNVTTGAINCYYSGDTRLSTQCSAGEMILLTYWSAGSITVDGTATMNNRWIASGLSSAGSNNVEEISIGSTQPTSSDTKIWLRV